MQVELGGKLVSLETVCANLRPHMVLGCWRQCRTRLLPWEDSVKEAHERSKLRYTDVWEEAERRGWKVQICPVEVWCRGLMSQPTVSLMMRGLGVHGQNLQNSCICISTVTTGSLNVQSLDLFKVATLSMVAPKWQENRGPFSRLWNWCREVALELRISPLCTSLGCKCVDLKKNGYIKGPTCNI